MRATAATLAITGCTEYKAAAMAFRVETKDDITPATERALTAVLEDLGVPGEAVTVREVARRGALGSGTRASR